MQKQIAVFHNNKNFCYYLEKKLNSFHWKFYKNFNEFKEQNCNLKFCVFFDENYEQNFDRLSFYENLKKNSQAVLSICPEPKIYNFIKDTINEHDNCLYFVNGMINSLSDNENVISCIWWFNKVTDFYKNLDFNYFEDMTPYMQKDFYFDFLPGIPKKERLHIANLIENSNCKEKIFLAPFFNSENWQDVVVNYHDYCFWEKGIELITNNYNRCKFFGQEIPVSVIIPKKIYNKTSYSIVTETVNDFDQVFISEKTAKAILAKRLFVMFGSRYQLKTLHKLGFKTFDGIIDERYDEVFVQEERILSAFQQVEKLCELPQKEILEKIRPIVEHNYNLLINYNFYDIIVEKILEKIHNF